MRHTRLHGWAGGGADRARPARLSHVRDGMQHQRAIPLCHCTQRVRTGGAGDDRRQLPCPFLHRRLAQRRVWRDGSGGPCAWAIAKNSRLSATRRSARPLLKRWSTLPTSKGRLSTWRPIWKSTMSLTRWKHGAGLCRVYAPSPPLFPAMVGGVLSLIHGERLPVLSIPCVLHNRASHKHCRHICQNQHSGEARTDRSSMQRGIFHLITKGGRTNGDIKGQRSAHSLHVLTSQELTLEPRGGLDQNGADGELANS